MKFDPSVRLAGLWKYRLAALARRRVASALRCRRGLPSSPRAGRHRRTYRIPRPRPRLRPRAGRRVRGPSVLYPW